MTVIALILYLVAVAAVFGGRTWLHRRRTGSSGFHGISGTPGSLRWWAGVLFVLALVLGAAAPALAIAGAVMPAVGSLASVAADVGLVLMAVGFAGVLAAQSGMGSSWRIGVEQSERTELVTGGVFAAVRNPIFSAMVLALVGLVLVVPTWPSVAALACLVTAVQLQVRLIEEPYLVRVHGATYRFYGSRTGRFVPGIGRLTSAEPEVSR